MKILFLTIGRLASIEDKGIYPDMIRCFRDNGHDVYTVSSHEKRTGFPTVFCEEYGVHSLRVRTGNITKCSLIEKGVSTICIEWQFKRAIIKYLSDIRFDLVVYSTPPITLAGVVEYVKKRDDAGTYLLLKDIFPQNAVDLGLMSKTGPKKLLYKYFRNKERMLYALSDRIGCMSRANVDYVLRNNPEISPSIVEVCPNSIEITDMRISAKEREQIRNKYDIPLDKTVFVYGGNLGKPQGIPFLIQCLKAEKANHKAFFLIVGDGTEYSKLERYISEEKPENVRLMRRMPKGDYDKMVAACDVGMIFLDHRFTIPNVPSRTLSYMQAGLPVLTCTDPNSDIGKIVSSNGFGWWRESNNVAAVSEAFSEAQIAPLNAMGAISWTYLCQNYSVEDTYRTIMNIFLKED